jgi:alginate O-acetyltransferase complex protein AlgJ
MKIKTKTKTQLFVFFALLIMAIIPTINYKTHSVQKIEWRQWINKAALYNLDFILSKLSPIFHQIGISIAPNFVTVGKDSWLYLGDAHEQSLTRQRNGFAETNLAVAQTIVSTALARDRWLKSNAVSEFIVLLAPDKSTIYSDHMPNWAKPVPNTFTDSVVQQSNGIYLDTRSDLKAARQKYSEPLYYKTDTHWNNLGGWVAYRSLAQRLARSHPELQWFTESHIKKSISPRPPGDLASFLRDTTNFTDFQVEIEIDKISTQVGEHYFNEIPTSIESKNLAAFSAEKIKPLILVTSKYALNSKRVLWLHDSFGFAMEPFVRRSFTEVLQGPYASMDEARLEKIVSQFKPDYVVISVVERRISTEFFVK